jgi:hypothetical protein
LNVVVPTKQDYGELGKRNNYKLSGKLHIKLLIDLGWLTMTIPNKPTSPTNNTSPP